MSIRTFTRQSIVGLTGAGVRSELGSTKSELGRQNEITSLNSGGGSVATNFAAPLPSGALLTYQISIPNGPSGTFQAATPDAAWQLFANANGITACELPVNFVEIVNDNVSNPPAPVAATVQSSLLTNLISYWRLNQAPGSVRVDSVSGNNLSENIAGSILQVPGIISQAANFTGANNNFLTAGDSAGLRVGAGSFTLAFWVNPTNLANSPCLIHKEAGLTMNAGYRVDVPVGVGPRFQLFNSGSIGSVTYPGQLALGMWHLVVAWVDATALTLNIQVDNGAIKTATTATGVDGVGDPFTVGSGGTGNGFIGSITELGLWKVALSASQRSSLWNAGVGITFPFSTVP